MSNAMLRKSYFADVAIGAWLFIKSGSDQNHVTPTVAISDVILGISGEVGYAVGERLDVTHEGIEYITAGAAFAAGTRLTSNATGQAIAAAPGAGVNASIGAIALEAATAQGDVVRALITLGVMQG